MVVDIQEINKKIEKESEFVDKIREEVGKVIVGQDYMIDRLLHVQAIHTFAESNFNGFLFVNLYSVAYCWQLFISNWIHSMLTVLPPFVFS